MTPLLFSSRTLSKIVRRIMPEIAVDVAHRQAEQDLHDVVVEAADEDAVPADPSG